MNSCEVAVSDRVIKLQNAVTTAVAEIKVTIMVSNKSTVKKESAVTVIGD